MLPLSWIFLPLCSHLKAAKKNSLSGCCLDSGVEHKHKHSETEISIVPISSQFYFAFKLSPLLRCSRGDRELWWRKLYSTLTFRSTSTVMHTFHFQSSLGYRENGQTVAWGGGVGGGTGEGNSLHLLAKKFFYKGNICDVKLHPWIKNSFCNLVINFVKLGLQTLIYQLFKSPYKCLI